jgi:hypothetical protein
VNWKDKLKMGYDRIGKNHSIKSILGGFLSSSLWGAISILTWFELRKLFMKILVYFDPNAWAYQWRDYVIIIVLGLLWLIGYLLVWNISELNFARKRPLISTLKYSLWSLGVYGFALAVNIFIF